jgi:hypothetical protein
MAATLPLPAAEMVAFAASRVSGLRAKIATSAPAVAKAVAVARPRPLLPPVMRALRPVRSIFMTLLLSILVSSSPTSCRASAYCSRTSPRHQLPWGWFLAGYSRAQKAVVGRVKPGHDG